MRGRVVLAALAALGSFLASARPAAAGGWDVIYPDRWEVRLCDVCGIGGAEFGPMLLANTGSSNLDEATLAAATFEVTSSSREISLSFAIGTPVLPVIAPILPGEVVGSVRPVNQILLTQVAPGESFRDTQPRQFPEFLIERLSGAYEGPVVFDVTMRMGGYRASFTIQANVRLGAHAISFPSAARVTAVPEATANKPGTWGRIKQLYR